MQDLRCQISVVYFYKKHYLFFKNSSAITTAGTDRTGILRLRKLGSPQDILRFGFTATLHSDMLTSFT